MSNVANIAIRPMTVLMGSDTPQVQQITCRADTAAASLNNKYFLFQDSAGAKHYAWFNVASGGVDPAPAGSWTEHEVAIAALDSASTVASALAAILGAVSGFDAAASGSVVTLTHTASGFANPAYDPGGAVGTGFNFKVSTLGSTEVDIGCIDGDIEISGLQPDKQDITCHHTGTTVKGSIVSGYPLMQVTMNFKETDLASLKRAFAAAGHYPFLPVGASATELFGYGAVQVGQQIPTQKLRLHPYAKVSSDKSEDITFWKAEVMLDSIAFSGENIQTIPVTFSVYPDETKNKEISFFAVGDGSQAAILAPA